MPRPPRGRQREWRSQGVPEELGRALPEWKEGRETAGLDAEGGSLPAVARGPWNRI